MNAEPVSQPSSKPTRSPKLQPGTPPEKDPEWVPQHVVAATSATGAAHYALRPRTNRKPIVEIDDDDDDCEMDEEAATACEPPISPKDNDLVITISQMRRRQKINNSSASTAQSIFAHTRNEDLPCVPFPVNNFDDLVRLARHIQTDQVMYKDCQRLSALMPVLEELDAMIGLRSTKDALCSMILFELQNMPSYWRHMVITGAPGVGKSSIATIIAKILNRLGRTSSDEITRGNPLNMISDYEGQTKSEVNRVVQEALSKSGVLLIDEAPSLNDVRNRDSYGKKCLDMLMQLMDKYRDDLIVIFAGYKYDMETNVLQSNAGFRRRIQWYFDMTDYSADELHQIFMQKIKDTKFNLVSASKFQREWFRANYKQFPFFGGSVENFVHKIRTVHTRKTFGFPEKATLTDDTIEEGFKMYLQFTIYPMAEEKKRVEHENQQFIAAAPFMGAFGLPGMLPFRTRMAHKPEDATTITTTTTLVPEISMDA